MRHGAAASGARVEWDGTSDSRAEYLVAAEVDDDRHEKKEATEFLREALAAGPRLSKEVEEEAREAWGIAPRRSPPRRPRRRRGSFREPPPATAGLTSGSHARAEVVTLPGQSARCKEKAQVSR
ncbi:hypothetical protein [Streptomyces sp. 6N223]|uniref:hypothetical protein n=1 Tax=Streptomyces sp. 6N223 TaxID=3457412 RepID=UPI003FD1D846